MSVEYESKLTIGWRVEQDDIPGFEERWNEEWEELSELAEKASKLLGELTYIEDLCEEENSWCGDTQMIGVPMFRKELPIGEFEWQTDELADLAKDVYRQVMRKEPEDGPYLISWTQVS